MDEKYPIVTIKAEEFEPCTETKEFFSNFVKIENCSELTMYKEKNEVKVEPTFKTDLELGIKQENEAFRIKDGYIKQEEINSSNCDSFLNTSPTRYLDTVSESSASVCGTLQMKEGHLEIPTNIPTYKCANCPYESKHKRNLVAHLLLHKNPSDIPVFKCELCLFRTKYKRKLLAHAKIHRGDTLFRCDVCEFTTIHKESVKRHSLVHMDQSQVTMYKCDKCDFETKHKGGVKGHQVVHKARSELKVCGDMFKCATCSFETKYKNCLKRHLVLKHNMW